MKKTFGIYDHKTQWDVFVILAQKDIKFALCYYIALETGLRISDILTLRRPLEQKFIIKEGKTGKMRQITLSDDLWAIVGIYEQLVPRKFAIQGAGPSATLMFPFSRSTFWRHMKAATEACGLHRIGVHGLRKTYG